MSPLHCFLNFITVVVNSILSHITPIFYLLLSLYLIIWPSTSSLLSRSNSGSFLTQQESYLFSTLSKKWLVGWIITVNTIHIQRISHLFSKGRYFKYHRIHSSYLKTFPIPPTTYHKKEWVEAVNTNIPPGRGNPPTKEPPTDNNRRRRSREWKSH